ncbi:MAG: isochorismatase family protein [Burkholderiaceae bacterium]|jgi:nicotinamidase-related amidase|nr:isochorismatase family protein [Burkholderiaceae bacterium]
MLLDANESQLVLVDYQARLMPAVAGAEAILKNALLLATLAQWVRAPLWGTEQNPARLGQNPPEWRALCQQTLSKMAFSAVREGLVNCLRAPAPQAPQGNARSLPRHLRKDPVRKDRQERNSIVIAGCEAHVCLLQTALDLLDEEFEVWIVTDACGSRAERNRDAAFDRLAAAGAELVTTEMVGFEWLGSAEHPAFRDFQGLIR